MGLLRKMASITYTEEKKKDISSESSGEVSAEAGSSGKAGKPIRSGPALAELEEASAGIEFPLKLFEVLKRDLVLDKAALFLLDSAEDSFLPWALSGFDKTTSNRLRIPSAFLKDNFPDRNAEIGLLEKQQLSALKNYFSIREFSVIEKALFTIYYHKERPFGLFAAFFSEDDSFDRENSFAYLAKLRPLCSGKLAHSHWDTGTNPDSARFPESRDLLKELDSKITEAGATNRKLSIIILKLDETVAEILKFASYADPLRLKKEIVRLLSSMVPDNTSFLKTDTEMFVLMLLGRSRYDEKILNLQFSQTLADYFHCVIPSIIETVLCYPEDADTPSDFMKYLR